MPSFYFHLHNDVDVTDDEGKEFPDLAAARVYAFAQLRHLVGETAKESGRIVLSHRLDIEDEQRNVLDSIRFGDVVTIEP